jgi:DNA repair protein RecO
MKTHTTKAWILKIARAKENAVETLVYTDQFGKLCLHIGGVEKSGSKRISACDILKEVELTCMLPEGAFYGRLISVRELRCFELISQDIYRFVAASGLSEILDVLTPFALASKQKYELLSRCMIWAGSQEFYQAIQFYFLLRFLKLSGCGPQMNDCLSCGFAVHDYGYLTSGGVMCFKCAHKESYNIALDGDDRKSIIDFLTLDTDRIIHDRARYDIDRLKKFARFLTRFHASRPLKTEVFEKKLSDARI